MCILAKFVLLLGIISLVFHICIFGLTIGFLVDFLFMILFVFLSNRYCDSWIAKAIVMYAIIGTLVYFYMCSTNQKIYLPTNDKINQPQITTNRR